MYNSSTHPYKMNRDTPNNMSAPNRMRKATSGVLSASLKKDADMRALIAVIILISNQNTKGRGHVGFHIYDSSLHVIVEIFQC